MKHVHALLLLVLMTAGGVAAAGPDGPGATCAWSCSSPRTSLASSGDLGRRGLGQRVLDSAPASDAGWREVVGVVQDVHEDALYQPAPAFVDELVRAMARVLKPV
jgi:hypothetical protein